MDFPLLYFTGKFSRGRSSRKESWRGKKRSLTARSVFAVNKRPRNFSQDTSQTEAPPPSSFSIDLVVLHRHARPAARPSAQVLGLLPGLLLSWSAPRPASLLLFLRIGSPATRYEATPKARSGPPLLPMISHEFVGIIHID